MSYIDEMTVDELAECLLKDMQMLEDDEWVPDQDSIEAHCDLIEELQRRANKVVDS